MRNFIAKFYHTITTPGEWHSISIIIVGIAVEWALGIFGLSYWLGHFAVYLWR